MCEQETRSQQGLPFGSIDFDFTNLEIKRASLSMLCDACQQDAIGFYYNALLSFLEGCEQLNKRQYSWAIVKLYYTVYYCARAQMGFHNFLVLRKGNKLFGLHLIEGAKPHKCNGRNDHNTILELYKRDYSANYILSNTINGVKYPDYMMDIRETTNYKQQSMKEPYRLDLFDDLDDKIKADKTTAMVLEEWLADQNVYCFQENSAYLVTTYIMLKETAAIYKGLPNRMSTSQSKYIQKLLTQSKMKRFEADVLS